MLLVEIMIQVEIWSDVLCPFCYIGKRHLEAALVQFEHRDQVQVTWRSFQLDPGAERDSGMNTYQMLSKKYGQSVEQAKRMTEGVAQRAQDVGLKFDFSRAVMTNSFDAHRLIHLAAKHGLQDQAKERLLSAHFVEGKHVGDRKTLLEIGTEIGLDKAEVERLLDGKEFGKEVEEEGRLAQSFGANGVPFFVLNRKFGVSGAQPVEVFLRALHAAWEDKQVSQGTIGGHGDSCGDSGCEV